MIRIQIPSKGLSLLGLALVLLLASCGSPKRYAYLQDVELAKLYNVEHQSKIKVQPGDRLQIAVQSAYPELLAPFTSRGFQASVPGLASSGNTAIANEDERTLRSYGYVVDNRGEINFPVLGYLKVGGMTISEVAKFLEDRLKASKYVPDPRVTVQLANFQVYLLGATPVAKATAQGGTNTIFTPLNGTNGGIIRVGDKEELNILEALSYAGDLPINANVEKVQVIRRIDGQFVTYRMNLKSTELFSSPAFYLKQNDIIYVEPLYRRSENEGIERILQLTGYALGSISSIVAVVALLKR